MNECLPLLPRLKSIFVLNFKGKPLLCLQGSFRRGRRRCDRAGTETWQGKFLIQQGLFLKTSKDMFWFCFKVRSWEVSVADRALCSCRGKGSRSSSQLGPGGQAGVKQHRAAEIAAWTRSFPQLKLRLRLVQFPPDPAPHCTPATQPRGSCVQTHSAFTWDKSRGLAIAAPRACFTATACCGDVWTLFVLEV